MIMPPALTNNQQEVVNVSCIIKGNEYTLAFRLMLRSYPTKFINTNPSWMTHGELWVSIMSKPVI